MSADWNVSFLPKADADLANLAPKTQATAIETAVLDEFQGMKADRLDKLFTVTPAFIP